MEIKVKRIKSLITTDAYEMILCFDNNETRIVDFKRDVIPHNAAFKVLEDLQIFKGAKAQNSAVVWDSVDIDIEAADLYEVSKS